MINSFKNMQNGQAMTEFVIAAAFVLIPLFVIVPILGKYIDIKHASIQAARYEAWEYTVNYNDISQEPSNFSGLSDSNKPIKSISQIQNESRRRFFSDTDLLITSSDKNGLNVSDINPLWRYREGSAIYDINALDTLSDVDPELTPDPTNIFAGALSVIQSVFGLLASIMDSISSATGAPSFGFDAVNAEGYYKSTVAVPIAEPPTYRAFDFANTSTLFMQERNLVMQANAGVLSLNWSAGGVDHTSSQVRGLVPTSLLGNLLNNPLPLQSIASSVLLSPELDPQSLRFGYTDIDAVHPSVLDSGGDHSCEGGYCTH